MPRMGAQHRGKSPTHDSRYEALPLGESTAGNDSNEMLASVLSPEPEPEPKPEPEPESEPLEDVQQKPELGSENATSKTGQPEAADGNETSTQTFGTNGPIRNKAIRREMEAQITEQMMELRGIAGFEEAEQVGDILWDMSKGATTATVSCGKQTWEWTIHVFPTLPGRLWAWLREPVPISEEISMADWWKVFVFHLLSYCCPLLVFWSLSRKATPGALLADTRSYTPEFLNRSFWLGTSTAIPVMWYLGELPTLVKSEVWINICMYAFIAVANSHEEANLTKARADERTKKKMDAPAAAGVNSFSEELAAYSEFLDLAEDIELHTQSTGRLGTTGQRLIELESLPIQNPKLDSFDEFSFSRDYQTEISEARTGKVFTNFSVRFTELIVMLGRQAIWYKEHFEFVANPAASDPFCREKKKQYMSCLIKMKQSEIARLRSSGRLEEEMQLENDLPKLKSLRQDIAACQVLLDQLEQLSNQERNIILRVLPFMSIGLFLLLYVGNFAKVLKSSFANIEAELSHDDFQMSDVTDALDEWDCAFFCYAARFLSIIFLFTSFMMLLKWTLKQFLKLLQWTLTQFCGSERALCKLIDRHLRGGIIDLQTKLDLRLGPLSLSPHEQAKTWDKRCALKFLEFAEHCEDSDESELSGVMAEAHSSDECRCCQGTKLHGSIDPRLPLCSECRTRRRQGVQSALRLTEPVTGFVKRIQKGSNRQALLPERFCTRRNKFLTRHDTTQSEGDNQEAYDGEDSHELSWTPKLELVDSWRLMLVTYQIWCQEVVDTNFRKLSNELRQDENGKQWKHKNPKRTVSANVVAKSIESLSEFKAEQKFAAQRAIMIVGALSCAVAPWIHDILLGCDDDRICEAPTYLITNSSNSNYSNSTIWTACDSLRPPCRDSAGDEVFLNGSLCQLQPQRAGFDQVHACPQEGEEDPNFWWRLIAAFTEFTLTYSIFSLLLRVLRGYHVRSLFMHHFSQTVPWLGIRHTESKKYTYGLLPRFELNNPGNIVAWNKIRCYLQTFEAEEFNQEQEKIAWVILISLVMMVTKMVSLAEQPVQHDLTMSVLMDTLMIKIIVMQLQSIVVICNLLWTGVKTTRMQEHGLRHILLLKKSELTNYYRPLYFSASKQVDMLVPTTFTLTQLQECIESRLGISLAQQRIALHGISFYGHGSGSSVLDRQIYEDRRAKLITKKYRRNQSLTKEEEDQLVWYQNYLRKDDAVQSVDLLIKLKESLKPDQKRQPIVEDDERRAWLTQILQPYDGALTTARLLKQDSMDAEAAQSGNAKSLLQLHPKIDAQGTTLRRSRSQSNLKDVSAASASLKGPSLKALADAETATRSEDSPTAPNSPSSVSQHVRMGRDYVKYNICIQDGQDILVTPDKMHPSDIKLFKSWLKMNTPEMETDDFKTDANVLIIERGNSDTPVDEGIEGGRQRSREQDGAGDAQLHLTATPPELPSSEFRRWVKIDTMRHMIDSLVAIMEEERLPVTHLETIEDTRPTIRLPFYGPYPLTTALFASVTTVLFGAVSTSVTVLVSQAIPAT